MKFAFLFAFLTAFVAVLSVNAAATGVNAARMARGLAPLKPRKRYDPSRTQAKRTSPSGTPSCSTGSIQCCESTGHPTDGTIGLILGLLGVVVPSNVLVGVTCSPISVIGVGTNACSASPLCCTDNSYNGIVAIGCVPVTL